MHREKDTTWLEINNVEAWTDNQLLFKNLSLKLELGQNTAIIGPNGAGKSSVVKLISREIYPIVREDSSFKIFQKENIDIWELRSELGIVSTEIVQKHSNHIKVGDIVLSGFFGTIGINKYEVIEEYQQTKVDQVLHKLGLSNLKNKEYGNLSEGQKRRAIIGRSLVHNPNVLILDEPTNNLDVKSKYELLALLSELAIQGTTITTITHNVETIIKEVSRVILMKKGEVILDGPKDEILTSKNISMLYDTDLELVSTNGYKIIIPNI